MTCRERRNDLCIYDLLGSDVAFAFVVAFAVGFVFVFVFVFVFAFDRDRRELEDRIEELETEIARLKEEMEFYEAMNVNDSFLLNVLTGDTITKIGVGGALTDWVSTFILDCQEIQAWRNKNETTI